MSSIEKALKKSKSESAGAKKLPANVVSDSSKPESAVSSTLENAAAAANAKPTKNRQQARSVRFCDIDLEGLEQKGIITPGSVRSRFKEEYRLIKRPLLDRVFGEGKSRSGKPNNVIMVTSATPGEGKTFNAISLAISIADEQNRRVLLIDADVVNPSVARTFGVEESDGLVDYLSGDFGDISELLCQTNIEDLTFLQAGKRHHLTTELLASKQMAQLVDELSRRYPDRIIILDSPPLMHTSEAGVLASLAGQVVLVVAENATKQSDVKKAIARLGNRRDIGLILNKSRTTNSKYGYYYGYGEDRE
ncbi:MAG: polysaccharide biosynthesis tyrosine autokinase [Pseudomonadales bacterium]|nr:polysaccharide biosynthesis tyrosine autokinase [Pseudomonadales bacterium]